MTYNIEDLFLRISITEKGEEDEDQIRRNVGNLKIQSLPVELMIKIPGLNVYYQKKKDSWTAENVPSGEFSAEFTSGDKVLSNNIKIEQGMESHYLVDMVDGEVELLGMYPINELEEPKEMPKAEYQNSLLYSVTLPMTYFGLKYHRGKKLGWYLCGRYGFSEYTNYDSDWGAAHGHYIIVTAGFSYRINKFITPYLGAGGYYLTLFEDNSNNQSVWNGGYYHLEGGALIHFSRVVFDVGLGYEDTPSFIENSISLNLGIGFSFK